VSSDDDKMSSDADADPSMDTSTGQELSDAEPGGRRRRTHRLGKPITPKQRQLEVDALAWLEKHVED